MGIDLEVFATWNRSNGDFEADVSTVAVVMPSVLGVSFIGVVNRLEPSTAFIFFS